VVIRVSVNDQKKSLFAGLFGFVGVQCSSDKNEARTKAMKIAVGVETAAVTGDKKDQIEVTGGWIDAVRLATLLRKKVGFAEVLSVDPEKKEDDKKPKTEDTVQAPLLHSYPCPSFCQVYQLPSQEPSCSIL
ncbi:hypothetical protein RJ640_011858, partial [Escallonia rubra]